MMRGISKFASCFHFIIAQEIVYSRHVNAPFTETNLLLPFVSTVKPGLHEPMADKVNLINLFMTMAILNREIRLYYLQ